MSNWHVVDYLNHSYILSHDHLVKAAHHIHPPRVWNWYVPSPLHIYRMVQGSIPLGGAKRLVIAVASGLESLGHTVNIYTSHHDLNHCYDETRDGTPHVHHIISPFPCAWHGKFHVLFVHAHQLHLTLTQFLCSTAPQHDNTC